mmetsp:Transcript_1841/g.4874  ORF Transcript_1841/g.4874 Transcript_1841/m.4874 type:complete len:287 (-) Transcript_1841:138-998(-)
MRVESALIRAVLLVQRENLQQLRVDFVEAQVILRAAVRVLRTRLDGKRVVLKVLQRVCVAAVAAGVVLIALVRRRDEMLAKVRRLGAEVVVRQTVHGRRGPHHSARYVGRRGSRRPRPRWPRPQQQQRRLHRRPDLHQRAKALPRARLCSLLCRILTITPRFRRRRRRRFSAELLKARASPLRSARIHRRVSGQQLSQQPSAARAPPARLRLGPSILPPRLALLHALRHHAAVTIITVTVIITTSGSLLESHIHRSPQPCAARRLQALSHDLPHDSLRKLKRARAA